jgi:Flp pilus assembly protein CpaB
VKKKSPPYAIIGAVVLGLIGIFGLWKWKGNMEASNAAALDAKTKELQQEIQDLKDHQQVSVTPTPTDMRKVYYATQPIEAGARISAAFYEEKLTPNDILPEAIPDGTDIVGWYAVRPIEKGDPLTPHNINQTPQNLSERIPAGMRALALPIFNSDANKTGGFVVDGDKVDLLYTTLAPDGSAPARTEQVLENVQVLFVPGPPTRSDTTVGIVPVPTPGEPLSVMFLVTPEEAQGLIFLSQTRTGQFSMILRGRNDLTVFRPKTFEGADYLDNLKKLQATANKSEARVEELQKKIEAEEQKEKDQAASQGTTNETTRPTPPGQ